MAHHKNNRELLLRYLAGDLTPGEMQDMDARLLSGGDFLDQMEEARNDLLDAYAAGELSGDQKERLEKILRHGSIDRGPLGLARALQKDRAKDAAASWASTKSRGFLWRTAIAVICVAIAVSAIFYLKNRQNIRTVAKQEKTLLPTQQAETAQPSPSAANAASRQPAFALLLGGGVERGSARSVILPAGVKNLEVQILLPTREIARQYEVMVVFPKKEQTTTFRGLIPKREFSQKLVHFELPASKLSSGVYTFALYPEDSSNAIASYQALIAK